MIPTGRGVESWAILQLTLDPEVGEAKREADHPAVATSNES